jgi:hypothetical protein
VSRKGRVNPDPRGWTLEVQREHIVTQLARALEQLEELRQLPYATIVPHAPALFDLGLDVLRNLRSQLEAPGTSWGPLSPAARAGARAAAALPLDLLENPPLPESADVQDEGAELPRGSE